MSFKHSLVARWQHRKTRVNDGADKNELSYSELEESYKWARNETERAEL
jgi:hypothetical protein